MERPEMVDLICCGAINWDINLFVERLPRAGEEVPVKAIERVSGGTAANVSVAAARILGPGRAAFIGALGDDEIGVRQLRILGEEGVNHAGVFIVEGVESGQAYITIDERGENEIHTYFGANLKLTPQRLEDPERRRLIEEAQVAVVMDPPLETAERLASLSKGAEAIVVWDPGVYVERGVKALRGVMENVDYFVLNRVEFETLLGTSRPEEVAERLAELREGIKAIIKMGGEGAALCSEEEVIHIPALPLERLGMKVVNTVGCGDAFLGAFAASLVQGLDEEEALRRGCAAGAYKATRRETRGSPRREELLTLLERWRKLEG
jgi:ribokinase